MRASADAILRVVALLAACALGFAALDVTELDGLPGFPGLDAWVAAHPDPRDLGEQGLAAHAAERAALRVADVHMLLAGLSFAAVAWALLPRRPLRACAALALGSAGAGLGTTAVSVHVQQERAASGAWTLGDDALVGVAGRSLADTLRGWRTTIPEDATVLVVGTQDWLLNPVAWALFPRRIVPLVVPVPSGWSAEQVADAAATLPHGEGTRRFVVDLAALAAREAAAGGADARDDEPRADDAPDGDARDAGFVAIGADGDPRGVRDAGAATRPALQELPR
ncbi:MAG: hypothetical protein H6825_00770 [Planctomycetes bacterium]|nr:hypothetical protein [Planctomycetota bacterium]